MIRVNDMNNEGKIFCTLRNIDTELLRRLGLDPSCLSSVKDFDLGGFGDSKYRYDEM